MIKLSQLVYDNRAEDLAVVYLTRDPDLMVEKGSLSYRDLDLVIWTKVFATDKPIFAIETKGIKGFSHNKKSIILTARQKAFVKATDIPILFFVFDMLDDKGYFLWLKQPLENSNSGFGLTLRSYVGGSWKPITSREIAQIKSLCIDYLNSKMR